MKRILPQTYSSLYHALSLLDLELEGTGANNVPFSTASLERYKIYHSLFAEKYGNLCLYKQRQLKAGEGSKRARSELKMHVSHFVTNLNNAIMRGEMRRSERAGYDLDLNERAVPVMASQTNLIHWGKAIVQGEKGRVNNGGIPLFNPSIQQVDEKLQTYIDALQKHINGKEGYDLALEAVQHILKEGCTIIKDIWDEIEFTHRHDSPSSRRNKAANWGVRYVSSKSKRVASVSDELGKEILKEM